MKISRYNQFILERLGVTSFEKYFLNKDTEN
jgi:hypothetical protein